MMDPSMEFLRFIPAFLFGLFAFILNIIWNIILFNLGTLLQKNKETLSYFNITSGDASNHLINENNLRDFNPSSIISFIGTLLKIYAIAAIVIGFLNLFKYAF